MHRNDNDPRPVPPGPGQESVWDYPRPPRLERSAEVVTVALDGVVVAETSAAWRVLETSHPPTYYLPADDCDLEHFEPAGGGSVCEWKGAARYETVRAGAAVAERGSWHYPTPTPAFAPIAGHRSFYPARFTCTVGGEVVRPQPGGFYGGWITDSVVGPFKGAPGTMGW